MVSLWNQKAKRFNNLESVKKKRNITQTTGVLTLTYGAKGSILAIVVAF
jgi:hypothetical protein